MRSFEDINPGALFLYFICVSAVPMFSMDIVLLSLSFFGALTLYIYRNRTKNIKTHVFSLFMFLIISLINPIVSHRGETVLFVINNNPFTLESFIYGIFMAVMIISVIYWFKTFSQIMTSDKLLYVFGWASPKLALIISMTLRYIPLFKKQIKKINQTQKTLGLYNDENIIDNIKGKIRIISVMVTWTIENGIITAESMEARGYGNKNRTRFSNYEISISDIVFMILFVSLTVLTFFGAHQTKYVFYPAFYFSPSSLSFYGYFSYGVIVLLPTVIEIKESIKWKYLELKI